MGIVTIKKPKGSNLGMGNPKEKQSKESKYNTVNRAEKEKDYKHIRNQTNGKK